MTLILFLKGKPMELRITTLIENNPDDKKELCFEHGLSLLIEADGKRILFDTGQSGDFIKNARTLDQNLTDLDYVIISHGHYDHSGGFIKFIEVVERSPKLIVGDEFFIPKYKKTTATEYKYNGNSFDEALIKYKQIPIKKVKEDIFYLTKNIMIFHNFARSTDYETLSDKFYVDECSEILERSSQNRSAYVRDEFSDEIVLGINTDKGLVVIVGCSHVGIVNILRTIIERTGKAIYAIIGGTHLVDAEEFRIQQTISAFLAMNIYYIAVSHCTGEQGVKLIKENFEGTFIFNNTGNVINL
jgi:7,8-dihydropterin-6-yl-methyl-4-(beta-D-ribofuranosyl)aminobenzene 5'-phosphate synthase